MKLSKSIFSSKDMEKTTETYTHRQFLLDYQDYQRKTGNPIEDLDAGEKEFFVTWCRDCGKYTVTRLNIWYSVFSQKYGKPICFHCQSKRQK